VTPLGDTPYDAESPGKLHIETIGPICGGRKREDLHRAVASSFSGIRGMLEELVHSVLQE
jgi:hypothetical protein